MAVNVLLELKERLRTARSVAVLTGAGISADSGVPTFRGQDGLWRNFRAEDLSRSEDGVRSCELLLIIGTSGVVYPAASFASVARAAGAFVVEINLERTPSSALVDVSVQGRAKDLLPLLL